MTASVGSAEIEQLPAHLAIGEALKRLIDLGQRQDVVDLYLQVSGPYGLERCAQSRSSLLGPPAWLTVLLEAGRTDNGCHEQ